MWEAVWLLWWPVSAVLGLCWGEHVTNLSSAHSLPFVSSSNLLTLFESPTASTGCGRARRNLCVTEHSWCCRKGMKWNWTTLLSLGPGPHAAFLTGLNTQNLDPKATDRNYELWYFQPRNTGKQNLRKIWIYSPAHGCSVHCWPCSFKAGGTGVW